MTGKKVSFDAVCFPLILLQKKTNKKKIYFFFGKHQKYFISYVENIRKFTRATHSWIDWYFYHIRWNIFGIHLKKVNILYLSYDVAFIQWITSYHKKTYDHTCNNTLARTRNVIDHVRDNSAFSYWHTVQFKISLKSIKSHFERSIDKQNVTLVVISDEIYETRQRLIS